MSISIQTRHPEPRIWPRICPAIKVILEPLLIRIISHRKARQQLTSRRRSLTPLRSPHIERSRVTSARHTRRPDLNTHSAVVTHQPAIHRVIRRSRARRSIQPAIERNLRTRPGRLQRSVTASVVKMATHRYRRRLSQVNLLLSIHARLTNCCGDYGHHRQKKLSHID